MFRDQNGDLLTFLDDNPNPFHNPSYTLFNDKEINFSVTDTVSDYSFMNNSFFDQPMLDISSPNERLQTNESFFDPYEFTDFKIPTSIPNPQLPITNETLTTTPIPTVPIQNNVNPEKKNENLQQTQNLILNLLSKEIKNQDINKSLSSKSFIEQLIKSIQDHLNQQKVQSTAKNATPSHRYRHKSTKHLDDGKFNEVCEDRTRVLNPKRLGFIPSHIWEDKNITFGSLVKEFFWKKNNSNCRFYHKLFNALKMSEFDTFFIEFTGVEWLNDRILRVNKLIFARFLGIKSIDGSLFHQQGNFPSHGFFELTSKDAPMILSEQQLSNVDFETVRVLVHSSGIFVRNCTENDIEKCKWVSLRKK